IEGDTPAAYVATSPSGHVPEAERMTQLMIGAAHRRIWIANSYFIPSAAVSDMLIEKAKAGVDVRVLAPGKKMDMKPVRAGQLSVYDRLLEGGVRIWEYEPAMMHAKTMLVDDHLVMVGSTNLDVLSRMDLEEGTFVIEDITMAKELESHLEADFTHSLEIRWSWWRKRGIADRLAPALSPLIGRFL
ncbi:MAG: phospholipase D-like domain-containing protein, partial [Myxococcaceae bacterium]